MHMIAMLLQAGRQNRRQQSWAAMSTQPASSLLGHVPTDHCLAHGALHVEAAGA